jgi:hypothetical protein
VKGSGRDEPILVVIHICMETTQGISLYSYVYLKLSKIPYFSYYLLLFFFYKIREQEGRTGYSPRRGVGGWEGVQIINTHISKYKNGKKNGLVKCSSCTP